MAQPNDIVDKSGGKPPVSTSQSPAARRGNQQDFTKFTKDSVQTDVNEKFDDNSSAWELYGHGDHEQPGGFGGV